MTSDLARLGGVYALLRGSHPVADYLVQTNRQAADKGSPGWTGRLACARHVATLTATHALVLAAGAAVAGERIPVRHAVGGLAFNAAAHYVIDRRAPLRHLCGMLAWTGKDTFYQFGQPRPGRDDNPCLGTGAHALDQALHDFCLLIAAGIITRKRSRS